MRYINFLFIIMIAAVVSAAGDTSLGGRLLSDDPKVREAALEEAVRADETTRGKAVAQMREVLASTGSVQGLYAVTALGRLGEAAAPVIPELMAALARRDDISGHAAHVLSKLEAAVPPLVEELKSATPGPDRESKPISPPESASAPPSTSNIIRSSDTTLAEESALVLARMGPAAIQALPALVRAAAYGAGDLKTFASVALAEMGALAHEWLACALRDPDPEKRLEAARVLAGMCPPPSETGCPLLAALGDPAAGVRASAAKALYSRLKETPDCVPEGAVAALCRAVGGPDEETRVWSFLALRKIGYGAVEWLTGALKDPDPAVRAEAALGLAGLYTLPDEAGPAVLAAMEDADPAVRRAAAKAVRTYAIAAPLSLPDTAPKMLLKALKDADPAVRLAAAVALKNYAGRFPEALPGEAAGELAEALKDGDAALRSEVVYSLSLIASENARALDALIGALSDGDPHVRKNAAIFLSYHGPVAGRALPALRKNLESGDCLVRVPAAQAMLAIEPALENNADVAGAATTACPGLMGCSLDAISPLPFMMKELEMSTTCVAFVARQALFRISSLAGDDRKDAAEARSSASAAVPEIFFQCPEKYATEQERRDAIIKFVNDYHKAFPNSTMEELVAYRHDLLVSHSCGVVSKRKDLKGNAER